MMIGARFLIMTLLVFAAGFWARVFRASSAVYFAAGLVTLAVEMIVFGRWTGWGLMILPVAGLLGCWVAERRKRTSNSATQQLSNHHWLPLIPALLALLIFALTVMSAAATSGDFVFFWGTKGQRFAQERMLDVGFLRNPDHVVMHPEYPPLVPLYYAWTMLGAAELDWFGAMASAILFLALATLAIRNFTESDAFAAFFASLFALLCIRNNVAGNAEPALLFFEVLALCALFAKNDAIAAIALCGAVLTKIEGAVFAVIVIALLGRRWRVALPPLAVLGGWLLFAKFNGLLASSDPRYAFSFGQLLPSVRQLAGEMSFGLWYAPWIAIALLARSWKHIAAALAFLAFMAVIYARPEAHMEWSAQRVLMTPLVLFFFSAITRDRNG